MTKAFAEIAFTETVRQQQAKRGSNRIYDSFFAPETDRDDRLGAKERTFIEARDGFYQASVSDTGWPYVQFKGGPVGFLKLLDDRTIGYADFRGNRQYVSLGNVTGDDRVAMILMDYPNRARIKILGRARTVEVADDPELVERLKVPGYRARPERAVMITVEAFDWNCPAHIPQRFTLDEIETLLPPFRNELERLQAENQRLKAALDAQGASAPASISNQDLTDREPVSG